MCSAVVVFEVSGGPQVSLVSEVWCVYDVGSVLVVCSDVVVFEVSDVLDAFELSEVFEVSDV